MSLEINTSVLASAQFVGKGESTLVKRQRHCPYAHCGRTGRHNTYQPSVGLTLDPVITLTRWEKKAAQHAQADLLIRSCFARNSKNNIMRKTNYDSVNHALKKAEKTQVQKNIRF